MDEEALAARIRALHATADESTKSAGEACLEAGRLLLAHKQECGHGRWLRFLTLIPLPDRTAREYMQMAKAHQPKSAKRPVRSPISTEDKVDRSTRAGLAERQAALHDALIADPTQTVDALAKACRMSKVVVARERHKLVAEKRIPFMADRVRRKNPQWRLPPAYLLKALGILDTFRMYAVEISQKMPAEARAALLDPKTEQEDTARDGLITTIRDIRRILGELEDEITGPTNVVRAEDRFRA